MAHGMCEENGLEGTRGKRPVRRLLKAPWGSEGGSGDLGAVKERGSDGRQEPLEMGSHCTKWCFL